VHEHLPEPGGEVNGAEDCTAWPANFSNALTDILHWVLVCVGLIFEGSEVLHLPDVVIFLHDGKDGSVEAVPGGLNDSELQPFENMSFDFLAMHIWNFKLLQVNWLSSLQGNVMHQRISSAEVKFILADSLVILKKHSQILFLELFRHL
jgi:hypothetical protein